MINFAVLIEVHFCLSFNKNQKAFPKARQKLEIRGTGDIQPCMLVPMLNLLILFVLATGTFTC